MTIPCSDPDCSCKEPVLTDPVQALKFLCGRMKSAGISETVARLYAADLDVILAKYDIYYETKR